MIAAAAGAAARAEHEGKWVFTSPKPSMLPFLTYADYLEMYVNFRGREPEIEPLLKNRGLL